MEVKLVCSGQIAAVANTVAVVLTGNLMYIIVIASQRWDILKTHCSHLLTDILWCGISLLVSVLMLSLWSVVVA